MKRGIWIWLVVCCLGAAAFGRPIAGQVELAPRIALMADGYDCALMAGLRGIVGGAAAEPYGRSGDEPRQ